MPRSTTTSFYKQGIAVAVLGLTACVAPPGPDPREDLEGLPPVRAETVLASEDAGQWPAAEWWTGFGDRQLDALIDEGLKNSPDIAIAGARLRMAAAMAMQEGAARLPQVDTQATAYEDRRSLNVGFSDEIRQFLPTGWRSGADLSARLSQDIDIWGRNRAAHAAATSEARAAAVDLLEARLMLATGIASAYADLGQLFAERDVRRSALSVRQSSRDIVAQRSENGLETRGNLRQADAQVAAASADLIAAEQRIALRRNQISALLGAGPDRGLEIDPPAIAPIPLSALPQGITTDLIGRRPDVVSARERVEAAARRVDAARADYFPAIRLDALIGLQTLGVDRLFEKDSTYGRVGPAVSLPIFHGGALRGKYKSARATYDQALAVYESTVFNAYREVADVVTGRKAAGVRLAHVRDALAASEEAYSIARMRYNGGLSAYLDVLAVEDRMLNARLAVASLESEALGLDIALIRALGGGFGENDDDSAREELND